MPPITINWSDLEIAFERNSPDQESFLDLENGDLLAIIEGEPDAAARRSKVANNAERYLRVDPASSREQYRWMERFVASVADQALRERLLVAIDGKGAFRRFKDVLLAFPAERERWFTYRSDLLHFHIQTWIEHMHIEVGAPPPWGRVEPPEEPPELPRTAPSSGEAPGEILRRQARDLLDEIPAAELPSALVFLEFLRDRGSSPLLAGPPKRGEHRSKPDRDVDELVSGSDPAESSVKSESGPVLAADPAALKPAAAKDGSKEPGKDVSNPKESKDGAKESSASGTLETRGREASAVVR